MDLLRWSKWKLFQSILLIVRVALNVYSVITTFYSVHADPTHSYRLSRGVTFGFELSVIGLIVIGLAVTTVMGIMLSCCGRTVSTCCFTLPAEKHDDKTRKDFADHSLLKLKVFFCSRFQVSSSRLQ